MSLPVGRRVGLGVVATVLVGCTAPASGPPSTSTSATKAPGPPTPGAIRDSFARTGGEVQVLVEQGRPTVVRGSIPVPAGASSEDKARAVLEAHRDLYGISDVAREVRATSEGPDREGDEVVRVQRVVDGLEVVGATGVVHVRGDKVTYLAANFPTDIVRPTAPGLLADAASRRAVEAVGSPSGAAAGSARLVVFNRGLITGETAHSVQAWEVAVAAPAGAQSWTVYVDASTGEVALVIDEAETARRRHVFTAHNTTDTASAAFSGAGDLWMDEKGVVAGGRADSDASAVHRHLATVYDYFSSAFGRKSYDDQDSTLAAWVHFGTTGNNAQWDHDSNSLFFMDGVVSLDVVAHEFTHGVNRHSADLVYSHQPGALNESMSDVFAAFIDKGAGQWDIGEELTATALKGPIRSLRDPSLHGQPDHMNGYSVRTRADGTPVDHGGVHRNSGIPNKAAYLLTVGATHPTSGIAVRGIGQAKAEQIVYKALTEFMTPVTSFAGARAAEASACSVMQEAAEFGLVPRDCGAVNNAWAAVGVGPPDADEDGWDDDIDNCAHDYNPDQAAAPCHEAPTTTGLARPEDPRPSVSPSPSSGVYLVVQLVGGPYTLGVRTETEVKSGKLHPCNFLHGGNCQGDKDPLAQLNTIGGPFPTADVAEAFMCSKVTNLRRLGRLQGVGHEADYGGRRVSIESGCEGKPAGRSPETVKASSSLPNAETSAGQPLSYGPELVSDGKSETAWCVSGDGTGQTLTLGFDPPLAVSEIGILPGYAKVDPSGADRFTENRRVLRAAYDFSGGTSQQVTFDVNRREVQRTVLARPVTVSSVRVTVLAVTPGSDTCIAEAAVVGAR